MLSSVIDGATIAASLITISLEIGAKISQELRSFGANIEGAAEFSIMSAVRDHISGLSHDIVHHCVDMLMVPGHQVINTTTWNIFNFLFEHNTSAAISLVIFLLYPLVFLHRNLLAPLNENSFYLPLNAPCVRLKEPLLLALISEPVFIAGSFNR